MKIAEFSFAHRKAILLILFLLFASGIYSAFQLPSGIYPEVNFPRIVVVAEAGDLPTGNMMVGITRPLEDAVSGVPGIYRVKSRTIRGEAELSLQFLPKTDMMFALQQTQAKINEVRTQFPNGTQITAERLTPAIFPAIAYNLTGKGIPASDLRDYALYSIRPSLTRIPGVGQVRVLGDTVREIEVIVDPQKLSANHLTLEQVNDAIRKANNIEAVGRLAKDYKQFLVLTTSEIKNLDSIGDIAITGGNSVTQYLRDIAEVREGAEDKLMLITGDGEPAAQINITRQPGGSIVSIEEGVLQKMEELKRILPPQLQLSRVYDLAEFIKDSISSVRDAILIGCVLSVLILLVFLRNWRATLIAASSIPITLVITLFFLDRMGQTLNLMSLGGMAVAIGLVIDDAIVVVENIHRHLLHRTESGESILQAVMAGTNEIIGAVGGSTLTTVVVFLPLGLVEGVVGQFFAAFSITLCVAVLVSLVLAFTLIPLLSAWILKSGPEKESEATFLDRLGKLYERSLLKSLQFGKLVIAVTLLFGVLGIIVYFRLGSGFLPLMDEGSFVLDYWLPAGTSLDESDRILKDMERILKDTPEVEAFSRRTGAELGLFATEQSRGDILVRLKKDRARRLEDVMDEVRVKVQTAQPVCRIEFVQVLQDILGDLEGSAEPIEVKIFGDNLEQLQVRAKSIASEMEKIPGVVDLFNGIQLGNPEISISIDPTRAQRAGLDPQEIAKQLSNALLGQVVTELRQADRLIGVRVRIPDADRFNYETIRQFPLLNESTGALVPLYSVANFQEIDGQNELLRENQRQMMLVTARLSGASLGEVIPKVQQILNRAPLPPGGSYELGGQYESQQHSFRQLLLVLAIAIMLVFILLVIQFQEFTAAVVILSAAPLSLIGALLMLWITGTEFNVSSFMGLILLMGLIVKNGIILIEYTFQIRGLNKLSLADALVVAGKTRLRPILMTTLATLFGLFPLALGIGAGSELQKPLALAVIGGLSLSTLVTLIFVPVLLSRLSGGTPDQ